MAEKLDELEVQGLEEGDKDVDDLDFGANGFVFKVSIVGLPCMAKKLHRILTNKEIDPDLDLVVFNYHEVETGKMEIAEIKDALEEQLKKSHPRYQLAIDCLQDEPKLRPSTADLNDLNQLGTKHPKSPEDVASILQVVQPREADHHVIEQLQHEAQLMAAEKLSLKQQLEETTRAFTLKEKQLEIAANEKAAMTNEIAQAKATSNRMGVQLQAARERLDTAISNTANLHDEVMAKTAQVKQYKKQTDSFKANVEEANIKLLKTQRELQRHQELIKTIEEDIQYQIDQVKATAEKDKLAYEFQTRKQHMLMLEDKTRELETLHREWEQFNDATRQQSSDELTPYILPHLPELVPHGFGSYGSLYRIQLNGISCIAKRIHLLGPDKQAAYQKFRRECVLLSQMRHPNIVQFMGVHYGPQRDYGRELTLVMERLYMNLENCLEQYKNIEMWLKVSILLDVSQGLLHLHSQNIVHCDVAAHTILLTTSFHAKIADLAVSQIIDANPASKQIRGPGALGYMPPEALTENPKYGYALDVFSFGVLILYVLLQEYPQFVHYENLVTDTSVERKEVQIQKRMKWISKLSPEDPMRRLICCCLQDEPQRRPLSQDLNLTLISFAQQYPKPFVDAIEMQRRLTPTAPPIPLRRRLSPGQK